MNPYTLPNRARVTIREILVWIVKTDRYITANEVAGRFGIDNSDAYVRMNKLWKWGYVRKQKRDLPPRVYEYAASRFGRKAATRWTKKEKRV